MFIEVVGIIRALIRNPDTGQRRWFAFPLYFGKLVEIGFSGDFNDIVEVVEVDGTNRFGTGYCTLNELEDLNKIAEGYY